MITIIRKIFGKTIAAVIGFLSKISWKQTHPLRHDDYAILQAMLAKDYYIILTRRGNHLSTYLIAIANFFMTGKFSFWSHVLLNLEDDVTSVQDFRLIEAIGSGTQFSTFEQVFDGVDAVALLTPSGLKPEDWTKMMDQAKIYLGRPYDSLFDLTSDNALSCVELTRNVLKANTVYEHEFKHFEHEIAQKKNLTPQMFANCHDFTSVFEIRR